MPTCKSTSNRPKGAVRFANIALEVHAHNIQIQNSGECNEINLIACSFQCNNFISPSPLSPLDAAANDIKIWCLKSFRILVPLQ